MTPFDRNLVVLHQFIRRAANCVPEAFQAYADVNAEIEERDIIERLWTCETDAERERVVRGYLHIWGATA